MSIVPMAKVTLYGLSREKLAVLDDIQVLGCLHLIPARPSAAPAPGGPSASARRALKFLLSSPVRRRQRHAADEFDAEEVERRALAIEARMQILRDERDFLRRRIRDLSPWGNFALPRNDDHPELRLWFYKVPHYLMQRLPAAGPAWQVVYGDAQASYVVVVAPQEPQGMPVPRTHTGRRSLSELRGRLEQIEQEFYDLRSEREALTRWCDLFARSLNRLEDGAALRQAAAGTRDEDPLFAVSGWIPARDLPRLRALATRRKLALVNAPAAEDEEPPTLLANRRPLAAGEDLVTFYLVPGYGLWDPSAAVLLAFATFFAMIVADAGYALVLAVLLAVFWRRLSRSRGGRRLRAMAATCTAAALGWGVLAGSYFGISPTSGVLAWLHVVQVSDTTAMMKLSVAVGVAHIAAANLALAWNARGSVRALASLGWVSLLAAGTLAWIATETGARALLTAAAFLGGAGAVAILTCSSSQHNPLHRIAEGLLSLTRVVGLVGDVLSYLRLFALAFAGASLAAALNQIASLAGAAVPGASLPVAGLVLLIGHGMNFALGVASGVVHGLRLNFIEFFNWGLGAEGRPFRPFEKKEKADWTTSW